MNDSWRYCKSEKDKLGKYALDYRIVCHGYRSSYSFERDQMFFQMLKNNI